MRLLKDSLTLLKLKSHIEIVEHRLGTTGTCEDMVGLMIPAP